MFQRSEIAASVKNQPIKCDDGHVSCKTKKLTGQKSVMELKQLWVSASTPVQSTDGRLCLSLLEALPPSFKADRRPESRAGSVWRGGGGGVFIRVGSF